MQLSPAQSRKGWAKRCFSSTDEEFTVDQPGIDGVSMEFQGRGTLQKITKLPSGKLT